LGAYVSDSAANVIFSLNSTTFLATMFINGKPFTTPSNNSIDESAFFPDLDIVGSSVAADFSAVVYTLRWFPLGAMTGSPTVYTFGSD
ncbi:MAG: hypothetical protein RLZZ01_454, partial [Actinomycetota bacterium]